MSAMSSQVVWVPPFAPTVKPGSEPQMLMVLCA